MTHTPGRPAELLPLENVDPTGDITLLLHNSQDGRQMQSSIRVSSKVLSLASPVFAAMLSPNFAEGQGLGNATSQEIPTINLHDDNAEAMLWLCKALHFKMDLNVAIDFSLLKELAILCDKYELTSVLYSWSHAWLQHWPGSLHGNDKQAEMLWISYALGNENCFWRTSRDLMQSSTTEELAALKKNPLSLMLPEGVLDCITYNREAALIEVQQTIQDVITPLLEHDCSAANIYNCATNYRTCDHLTSIGIYFAQLSKYGLWPINQQLHKTSFVNITAVLTKIKGYYDRDDVSRASYGYNCRSPIIDIRQLTEQIAPNAARNLEGLCLNCVKDGKYTIEDANCRREACKG